MRTNRFGDIDWGDDNSVDELYEVFQEDNRIKQNNTRNGGTNCHVLKISHTLHGFEWTVASASMVSDKSTAMGLMRISTSTKRAHMGTEQISTETGEHRMWIGSLSPD